MHPTAPTTIHINPNFRKIHINPMFLNKPSLAAPAPAPESTLSVPVALPKPTNIHINPRFLNNSKLLSGLSRLVDDAFESDYSCASSEDDGLDVEPEMIIAHIPSQINRKLVRKPVIPATTRAAEPSEMLLAPSRSNYLKIGSRKLIRAPSTRLKVQHKPKMHRKPMQTKYKIVKEHTTYKIDRRSAHMKLKLVPVAQLHLTSTRQKLLRIGNDESSSQVSSTSSAKQFANRKLALISINGIVYKSTNMKLQKTAPSTDSKATLTVAASASRAFTQPTTAHRTLYVRGEKFVLNANGRSLLRLTAPALPRKTTANVGDRIHIGGLTYARSANATTYELTNSHKNRYHLNLAKQRSINLLSQKLTKSNVPCAIYRKLGKCAAFTRGKCTKLHDPKLVDICPKLLKGDCDKTDCLLYHEVTLAKMPTCRYYLLGLCAKTNCLYLHKKVNENTSICTDFLRGYCAMAAECPKRHDLLCPEFQRKGECKVTRCPYPHPRRRKAKPEKKVKRKEATKTSEPEKAAPRVIQRYFVEDRVGEAELNDGVELSVEGKAKLNRVLNKIEQMKVNYLLGTDSTVNTQPTAGVSDDSSAIAIDDDGTYVGGPRKRPQLGTLPSYIPFE